MSSMRTKRLAFKGEAPIKPRKRVTSSHVAGALDSRKPSAIARTTTGRPLESELAGWVDAEYPDDISGPIMIVHHPPPPPSPSHASSPPLTLPADSGKGNEEAEGPISLISDARGSTFTLPIASPTTIDDLAPHDVRQTFIAAPVLGTTLASQDSIQVSLKNGGTSKYLSTDRFGSCTCDTDAIGSPEQFLLTRINSPSSHIPSSSPPSSHVPSSSPPISTGPAPGCPSPLPEEPASCPSSSIDRHAQRVNWTIKSSYYARFLSIDQSITNGIDDAAKTVKYSVRGDVEVPGPRASFTIRVHATERARRRAAAAAAAATARTAGTIIQTGNAAALQSTKKELERKCGRTLAPYELDMLRRAERDGSLGEAILDMRVKGRSDKFG